jgi:hypothetical protein
MQEENMPVHRTKKNGKPAFQWGAEGKKYPYTPGDKKSREEAKRKAQRQGRAVRSSGYKE